MNWSHLDNCTTANVLDKLHRPRRNKDVSELHTCTAEVVASPHKRASSPWNTDTCPISYTLHDMLAFMLADRTGRV